MRKKYGKQPYRRTRYAKRGRWVAMIKGAPWADVGAEALSRFGSSVVRISASDDGVTYRDVTDHALLSAGARLDVMFAPVKARYWSVLEVRGKP